MLVASIVLDASVIAPAPMQGAPQATKHETAGHPGTSDYLDSPHSPQPFESVRRAVRRSHKSLHSTSARHIARLREPCRAGCVMIDDEMSRLHGLRVRRKATAGRRARRRPAATGRAPRAARARNRRAGRRGRRRAPPARRSPVLRMRGRAGGPLRPVFLGGCHDAEMHEAELPDPERMVHDHVEHRCGDEPSVELAHRRDLLRARGGFGRFIGRSATRTPATWDGIAARRCPEATHAGILPRRTQWIFTTCVFTTEGSGIRLAPVPHPIGSPASGPSVLAGLPPTTGGRSSTVGFPRGPPSFRVGRSLDRASKSPDGQTRRTQSLQTTPASTTASALVKSA